MCSLCIRVRHCRSGRLALAANPQLPERGAPTGASAQASQINRQTIPLQTRARLSRLGRSAASHQPLVPCRPISPHPLQHQSPARGRLVVSITAAMSVQSRQCTPAPPGPPRVQGVQARFAVAGQQVKIYCSPLSHRPSSLLQRRPVRAAARLQSHPPVCAPPRVQRAPRTPRALGLFLRPCPPSCSCRPVSQSAPALLRPPEYLQPDAARRPQTFKTSDVVSLPRAAPSANTANSLPFAMLF